MGSNTMTGSGVASDLARGEGGEIWYQIGGRNVTREEYRAWEKSLVFTGDEQGFEHPNADEEAAHEAEVWGL